MGAYQAGLILLKMEEYAEVDELSGTDVLVLVTLFSFAADSDRPQAFPSAARIAARSRLGHRTVQRSLEHLEKVGVITGERRHRRPTRWSLDPYFIKGGGVAKVPEVGGPETPREEVPGGSVNATATPAYVTATQVLRQSGGQHASERRTANATGTHQSTEVGSGAKRRNRTDVKKKGGGSGKPARSARRAPSAPPPTVRVLPPEPPPVPCPHGVPGGLRWADRATGQFKCSHCTAIAPDPKTGAFHQWLGELPGLDRYLRDHEAACASDTNEQAATKVARAMFHRHTWTQPYQGVPSKFESLFRRMKAYAVDHAEPGRVGELLAASGQRPRSLGLAGLPGRCAECEAHIETQGHLTTCTQRSDL